jgi:hypothetical protein
MTFSVAFLRRQTKSTHRHFVQRSPLGVSQLEGGPVKVMKRYPAAYALSALLLFVFMEAHASKADAQTTQAGTLLFR